MWLWETTVNYEKKYRLLIIQMMKENSKQKVIEASLTKILTELKACNINSNLNKILSEMTNVLYLGWLTQEKDVQVHIAAVSVSAPPAILTHTTPSH